MKVGAMNAQTIGCDLIEPVHIAIHGSEICDDCLDDLTF